MRYSDKYHVVNDVASKKNDDTWINDEVNRSIKEVTLKTKELKNKKKIRDILGYDIDTEMLKKNYKHIRNQLYLENNKRWG